MALPNMVDQNKVSQLVSTSLLNNQGVQDLVGNQIHGGWARDTDLVTIPKPAIGFILEGGATIYEGVITSVSLEVYALSSDSESEAIDVHRAAFEALQAECLSFEGFDHRGLARIIDEVRAGWYPTGSCWFANSRWNLTVARDNFGA